MFQVSALIRIPLTLLFTLGLLSTITLPTATAIAHFLLALSHRSMAAPRGVQSDNWQAQFPRAGSQEGTIRSAIILQPVFQMAGRSPYSQGLLRRVEVISTRRCIQWKEVLT